jgi:hypothetical protein
MFINLPSAKKRQTLSAAATWVEALKISLRLLSLAVLFSTPAYAYVDPGSSLLLLQGLFAFIGAALTYFRKPWQLLAKLIARKKKDSDA